MDIEESYRKQRKAVEILFNYNVNEAFHWIINNHNRWSGEKNGKFIQVDIFENQHVSSPNSKNAKKTANTIKTKDLPSRYDFEYCFQYKENEYRVSCKNIETSFGHPYGSYTGGDFYLVCNNELVFETSVFKDDDEGVWNLWYTTESEEGKGSIKICKLGNWIKDLPNLIQSEKEKFKLKDKKKRIELEKLSKNETLNRTNKNFDLGEYDE
jgi:hypothetical protein